MNQSLSNQLGSPIEAEGRQWFLIMKDLGSIQDTMPLPPEDKVVQTWPRVLLYCNTARGMDECLRCAAKRGGNPILQPELDKMEFHAKRELVERVLRVFVPQSESDEPEENADPLASSLET